MMRLRTRGAGSLAILVTAGLMGCQLIGGFEAFQGTGSGATSGTVAASSSSGATCMAGAMPGKGGPAMVFQQRQGAPCFWIDATEVSAADYAAFQSTDPTNVTVTQTPACMGKTSFLPGCAGDAGSPSMNEPVVCVDWCDAEAYCNSVGKRLCSGEGTTNAGMTTKSEWYAACSADGVNVYPYGSSYSNDACNGMDNPSTGCSAACSLADVGTLPGCQTASGVFDLSGNAAEWADECDGPGSSALCNLRGGSVASSAPALQCDEVSPAPRTHRDRFTGFRCCADAQ